MDLSLIISARVKNGCWVNNNVSSTTSCNNSSYIWNVSKINIKWMWNGGPDPQGNGGAGFAFRLPAGG